MEDEPNAAAIPANTAMTRTELIDRIRHGQPHLNQEDAELAVKTMLDQMSNALAHGQRIEIRGFGAFSLRRRASRVGRNPKTGASVALPERHVPYFKPGKELRERVDVHAGASGSERRRGSMRLTPGPWMLCLLLVLAPSLAQAEDSLGQQARFGAPISCAALALIRSADYPEAVRVYDERQEPRSF